MSDFDDMDQQWLDAYLANHDHSDIFDNDGYSEVDDSTSGMDDHPIFTHTINQAYAINESAFNSLSTDNLSSTVMNDISNLEGSAAPETTAIPSGFAISHGTPEYHDSDYSRNSSFETNTSLNCSSDPVMRRFASPLEESSVPSLPLTSDLWNSSASHVLRASNPYSASNNIQGPVFESNDNNNDVEEAWDKYCADVLHENPALARHFHSNGNVQKVDTMNDINDSSNASTPSSSNPTPAKVRATCEGCRKLKIKCLPARDGGPCQKCEQKGRPCIRQPRAAYGSRSKRR